MSTKRRNEIEESQVVDKYIDSLCEDSSFLCQHRDLCVKSSLYTGMDNINTICTDIVKSNECENQIGECLVQVVNTFDETPKTISTPFRNIIIPIPNALDEHGNNKFIRLPKLDSSHKLKSIDTCNVCACLNRFAGTPGAADTLGYTSPGQDTCKFSDKFENIYYPVYIEDLNKQLKNFVDVGKYKIHPENVINIHDEKNLEASKLFEIISANGVSKPITRDFIAKVLYPYDDSVKERLNTIINNANKNQNQNQTQDKIKSTFSKIKSSVGSQCNVCDMKYVLLAIIIAILIYYFLLK